MSEAAAARPTAPSGAENQDNFIVIISLPLSPSVQLMKEERGEHEGGEERKRGGTGRTKNTKEKMCVSCLVSCRVYACEGVWYAYTVYHAFTCKELCLGNSFLIIISHSFISPVMSPKS